MYLWMKLIHILAVVLFLGNIITGLFWHRHAERTRHPRLLAHTMDGIIRSDRLFTMPGVIVIIATGIFTAVQGGIPLLRTGWIAWSLLLFAASGLAFMFRVAPLQRELRALADAGAASGSFNFDAYHKVAVRWEIWGAVATVTPLAALWLMVLKPAF
ncbi:MAG: DUF2269 domain-containing protein [Steroidobacteraceae bacterium]|nr:DUF2269 domain-containing protein [Steroidobacteraceae bacterium]